MFSTTATSSDNVFEEREASMENVIGQHNYMAISSSSSSPSVQNQQQSNFDMTSSNSVRSLRGKGDAPYLNADKMLERKSSDSKMILKLFLRCNFYFNYCHLSA